jgi:glycerate 2-kinase
MKVIIAPDKFKGSLTSFEVCDAISAGIKQYDKNAAIHLYPMADGGDGFALVMQHYLNTKTIFCNSVNAMGTKIKANWQWSENNKTAFIEMATASGLVLIPSQQRNPLFASTYGTGLLIKNAIEKGAEKIIIGLGGSATNDAGMGILQALGFKFFDARNNLLTANGENLQHVHTIIAPTALPTVAFEIACDVQNVLYGKNGAAFVYAPQKGANKNMVQLLDKGLRNFSKVLMQYTPVNVATIPGTGAAGGVAAGLLAFFNVILTSGVQMVINASGLLNNLYDTDLLITGEGKIDTQSLEGKVLSELAQLACKNNIKAVAFCGLLQQGDTILKKIPLQKIISLSSPTTSVETAIKHARQLLTKKAFAYFSELKY